jgi:hypothetical protein
MLNIYLSFNMFSVEILKGGYKSNFPPYNFFKNAKLIINTEIVGQLLQLQFF